MNLLVVGTLAFDSVETTTAARSEILGGSASFLARCASYFCPVQMVGIIGEDFPQAHLDYFESVRIDTRGVERAPGKTFRWSGRYEQNMNNRHTLETQLNVLEQFEPRLPEAYRKAPYLVLGNFDPVLQHSVLEQLEGPKLVACDTMNYWIEGSRKELDQLLAEVDLLLINDSEARELSGEHNLVHAARVVRAMGPRILVIKLGEHGALLFDEAGTFAVPAFLLDNVVDPTGAGDSFAGGMMGFIAQADRSDPTTLRQALVFATVMASFSVEDFSIDAIRALSPAAIRDRVEQYRTLTQIPMPDFQAG